MSPSFKEIGRAEKPGRRQAGLGFVLLALCCNLCASACGQEPAPDETEKPTANTAPSSPWWPNLDWSPYKPSIPAEPGCTVDADVALVFPHLSSLLTTTVPLGTGGPGALVSLPNARLDPTVSPLLRLSAFHFGPGYGELAASYRLLASDGRDVIAGFDGPAARRSRLNLQTFSLDYARRDCPLSPTTTLSWEAGVRLQIVFFDTQAQSLATFEQARNYFFGGGPHAGVGVNRVLGNGVQLFGRCDAALLVGYNTVQDFVFGSQAPVLGLRTGATSQEQIDASPTFLVRTGLSWTPARVPALQMRGGYQFEQWYDLGQVGSSRGNLNAHGVFVSCEWGF